MSGDMLQRGSTPRLVRRELGGGVGGVYETATDLSRLRVRNSNFAVRPAWIKDAVVAAMPHTIQVGTYGLTEAAGTVSTSRLHDSFEVRTGRCGFPLDGWGMRIVDPETGRDCGADACGDIVLRGPPMVQGRPS